VANLISLNQPVLQLRQSNVKDADLYSELRTLLRDIEKQFLAIAIAINDNTAGGAVIILNGATSVVVTHGVSFIPLAQDINIISTENPTNDPGNFWLSSITNTQFTINCRQDPGASGLGISWNIHRTT